MNYTVIWKPDAHDDLAVIWAASNDRQSVTDAANRIDQVLGTSPREQGESRSGTVRILFEKPLAILFDVNDGDLIVSVAKVWAIT